MTSVPESKKDHIECSLSNADLFTPAFMQSGIDEDIPSPNSKTMDQ